MVVAPELVAEPEPAAPAVAEEDEVDFLTFRFDPLVDVELCGVVLVVDELEAEEEVIFSLSDDLVMIVALLDVGVRFEAEDLVVRLGVTEGEALEELDEVTEERPSRVGALLTTTLTSWLIIFSEGMFFTKDSPLKVFLQSLCIVSSSERSNSWASRMDGSSCGKMRPL